MRYLTHAGFSLQMLSTLLIFNIITNEPAILVISNAVDAEIGPAMHGGWSSGPYLCSARAN